VCRACEHKYAVKEGVVNFLLPGHLVWEQLGDILKVLAQDERLAIMRGATTMPRMMYASIWAM
jgi:hypothetical protein